MKNRTQKEILAIAKEIWPHSEISVITIKNCAEITVSGSNPTLSFWMLKKLAEFFETDNIDESNRSKTDGCPTCDYGSSHSFDLIILP